MVVLKLVEALPKHHSSLIELSLIHFKSVKYIFFFTTPFEFHCCNYYTIKFVTIKVVITINFHLFFHILDMFIVIMSVYMSF